MYTINTIEDLIHVLDEKPEWIDALRARLLTPELLDLPEKFTEFVAEMNTFVAETNKFVAEMNKFVAKMNAFVAKVDKFIEATNKQFEAMNKQFEAMNKRMDKVEGRLDKGGGRLDKVEDRLDKVESRLEKVEHRLDKVESRLEKVEHRLDKIESRLDKVEHRLDKIESRLDKIESRLDRLETSVGVLKGGHARTSAIRNAALIAHDMGFDLVGTLSQQKIISLIHPHDAADIPRNERRSFYSADLIMEAAGQDGETCYIAVEISFTANGRDTRRAIRNAAFLTRFTGKRAYAVVAGMYKDNRIQNTIESGDVFWFQLDAEDLEVE